MPDVPLPRSRFIEGRTELINKDQSSPMIRIAFCCSFSLFAADLQSPTNHSSGNVSSRQSPPGNMTAQELIRRSFPRFHLMRNYPCHRPGSATVTAFGRALIAFGDLQPTLERLQVPRSLSRNTQELSPQNALGATMLEVVAAPE